MNAKERLRAYLEQRRELGESELMLDALGVDDVLRMVGALGDGQLAADSAPAPVQSSAPAKAVERNTAAPAVGTVSGAVTETPAGSVPSPSGDWSAMMQSLQGVAKPKPVLPAPPAAPTADGTTSSVAQPRPSRAGTLHIDGIVVPLGLRVERSDAEMRAATAPAWPSLSDVASAIAACKACGLAEGATQSVPGCGNPDADVMVIGEAPGEQEDLQGEPFVGPAGQLLTKILGAIQLSRDTVYICNVLKHRPPNNRNPLPDEVRACAPFLQRQIDLVQPKLILAFGTFAAQSLLSSKLAIGKLRQQVHTYQGIPLVATYHPAALLRNDAWKRPTWDDMKLARKVLDATVRR